MINISIDKFKNIGMFTDIHFGAAQSSIIHNEDCMEFVKIFIKESVSKKVDGIIFLGDFFENRNAINVQTINYGIQAIKLLNELNIPIFLIVGNHDLYHRHTRSLHSLEIFRSFSNVTIVDQPISINKKHLLLPYLFPAEYVDYVSEINKHQFVYGHFEFRNFYLSNSNILAEHGFVHSLLSSPTYIFSGHYHKRQLRDNIVYISNPFPTSYSDINDRDRGMAFLLDTELSFVNYDGPYFTKTSLSVLLGSDMTIIPGSRIRCLIDIDISYSEAQALKTELVSAYNLRELILEENKFEKQALLEEQLIHDMDDLDITNIDNTIKTLISEGIQPSDIIKATTLIEIYSQL